MLWQPSARGCHDAIVVSLMREATIGRRCRFESDHIHNKMKETKSIREAREEIWQECLKEADNNEDRAWCILYEKYCRTDEIYKK